MPPDKIDLRSAAVAANCDPFEASVDVTDAGKVPTLGVLECVQGKEKPTDVASARP